jgi:hypothetical protein
MTLAHEKGMETPVSPVEQQTGRPANADKIVRLSINLSVDVATALKDLAAEKSITITEGIRRAIAVWKFVEDEVARGNRLAVIERDKSGQERVREVILLSG